MTLNLFGSPKVTVSEPPARFMACDVCGISTRHEMSADGHWICWCGNDANARQLADERVMIVIEAVARMFLGMEQERRRRWFAVLVDLLGPLKQELLDAIGRSDF
jgi:hypothetical protein